MRGHVTPKEETMTSVAYENFQQRRLEVQQLVDAHGALVRLRKAEQAHA